MAKKKKGKRDYENYKAEAPVHRPTHRHSHIAGEMRELKGVDAAEEFVRHLLPHMKDRALGIASGTNLQPNWTPSVRKMNL